MTFIFETPKDVLSHRGKTGHKQTREKTKDKRVRIYFIYFFLFSFHLGFTWTVSDLPSLSVFKSSVTVPPLSAGDPSSHTSKKACRCSRKVILQIYSI